MPHFSITRLRLRSPSLLPVFFIENAAIHRQLRVSPGMIEARIYIDARQTFWTLSTWSDIAAMRAFRDSGAHGVSMPKLMNWCDEAHVASGQGHAPPDLAAAFQRVEGDRSCISERKNRDRQHRDVRLWRSAGLFLG
ncbi:MAG: hypothetical protein WDN76_11545 [Alphaproteobacteria bacterium]